MKDGERLEIVMPVSTNQSVPAEQSLFEQFQAQAAEVGFDMQINLLDLSSWYADLAEHNYNLVSAPYTKVGPSVLRIQIGRAACRERWERSVRAAGVKCIGQLNRMH